MSRVYIAIGSNVGDSRQSIAGAVAELGKYLTELRCAPIYTSRAVGYTDQPDFYNTAVSGHTVLAPRELLNVLKVIEQKVGRVQRFRWGPREIDLDIIFYDGLTMDKPDLTIPHPRFAERDFVLRPLLDLEPKLVDPRSKKKLEDILTKLPKSELSIN